METLGEHHGKSLKLVLFRPFSSSSASAEQQLIDLWHVRPYSAISDVMWGLPTADREFPLCFTPVLMNFHESVILLCNLHLFQPKIAEYCFHSDQSCASVFGPCLPCLSKWRCINMVIWILSSDAYVMHPNFKIIPKIINLEIHLTLQFHLILFSFSF